MLPWHFIVKKVAESMTRLGKRQDIRSLITSKLLTKIIHALPKSCRS